MRWSVIVGMLMVCGTGCGGPVVKYTPLNSPPRPMNPRPTTSVEMFTTTKPERPFVEVGMIKADTTTVFQDEGELLTAIRVEASKQGCEAVMITGEDKLVRGGVSGGNVAANEKVGSYRAACLMYK